MFGPWDGGGLRAVLTVYFVLCHSAFLYHYNVVTTSSAKNYENFLEKNLKEVEEYGLGDRKESDKPLVAAQTKEGKFPMNKEFRQVLSILIGDGVLLPCLFSKNFLL